MQSNKIIASGGESRFENKSPAMANHVLMLLSTRIAHMNSSQQTFGLSAFSRTLTNTLGTRKYWGDQGAHGSNAANFLLPLHGHMTPFDCSIVRSHLSVMNCTHAICYCLRFIIWFVGVRVAEGVLQNKSPLLAKHICPPEVGKRVEIQQQQQQ